MGEVQPEEGVSAGGIWRWKREWNGDIDHSYVFRKSILKYGLIERVYDRLVIDRTSGQSLHSQISPKARIKSSNIVTTSNILNKL